MVLVVNRSSVDNRHFFALLPAFDGEEKISSHSGEQHKYFIHYYN